ncbi:MAG: hypothetical protein J0J10_15695 [Bosea sp.]|uniref:hypothetical protein n=1 Tax=Bosea sp. (in: a-proteobacteria) TaxID=1871050 RepID=UPI001AC6314D|nr:hypothetical protein [Bosea sp. (in: a-proteobacteria)]MBN9470207.1 hypothetical protein [Bosea sp. (in: a-proteobacteria)]
MIPANDNHLVAYASNGVTIAHTTGAPIRPAPRPAEPSDDDLAASHGRHPLSEEFAAGRFTPEQGAAVEWWIKQHRPVEVSFGAGSMAAAGGGRRPFISRPRDALFAQEVAAERAMVLGRLYRLFGQVTAADLILVLNDALDGAEMRDLAPPQMTFPKEKQAAAGRIRLGAALGIVGHYADGGYSIRHCMDIVTAAADSCWALAAKRKLRAANDNLASALKKHAG